MGDFLAFRKMITPVIIQILFWLGVMVAVGTGLVWLFTADGIQKLVGLLAIVGGPILVRIYCELMILLFKIHESLNDIADNTGRSRAA